MAGIGGIGRVTAASTRLGNDAAGKILSASRMPNGKVNLDAVAAGIAYLAKADPKAAAIATQAIAKQLPPVQQGQLPREIAEAVRDQQRGAQKVPAGLTGAQKELMLDLGQIGLDIVGLVDPTPISDGLNGLVSLFRGDLLGAGISAVSMIPYLGDAAKLGKLGKWSKTIDRAIDIARAAPNSAMSKALRHAIAKIADGLNAIPASVLNKLPASAKKQILEMRANANAFLATKVDNVTALISKRRAAATEFYAKQGVPADAIADHLKGIDFTKPVEVVKIPKGTEVIQYQVPGGRQGSYYAFAGTRPDQIGIASQGKSRITGEIVDKVATRYKLKGDVEMLRSTAASITDTWSIPNKSVKANGGGIQFFSKAQEMFGAVK